MLYLLNEMGDVLEQKTKLVVCLAGEELYEALGESPHKTHILKLYLRLLDKIDPRLAKEQEAKKLNLSFLDKMHFCSVEGQEDNEISAFERCVMKIKLAHVFLKWVKVFESGLEDNTGQQDEEKHSTHFEFCLDYVKQAFSGSNIIDSDYLDLLKKNIEYDIELIAFREFEKEMGEEDGEDYRYQDYDDDEFDERFNLGIIHHLAYEDGEFPYSPYVHGEKYYSYIDKDFDLDLEHCPDSVSKQMNSCDDDESRYFGSCKCDSDSFSIAKHMSEMNLQQKDLLDMTVEERMKLANTKDIKEFCNLYPGIVSLDEANQFRHDGIITAKEYCKLICFNHNFTANQNLKDEIKLLGIHLEALSNLR